MVEAADLIIGMSLRHVQEVVLLDPASWVQTFRLKELVALGEFIGPRLPGQDLAGGSGRPRVTGPATRWPTTRRPTMWPTPTAARSTATWRRPLELEDLTGRLSALLWPHR